MINIIRIDSRSILYPFIEVLLHDAFPSNERRPDSCQCYNADHEPRFHCCVVEYNDAPAGLVCYWELEDFCYIEHLATIPSMRHNGIGTSVLSLLKLQYRLIVLEVEPPTDAVAQRRIAFYRLNEFELWTEPYMQPAYSPDQQPLPMQIMSYGPVANDQKANIISSIHRTIYGVEL